jgi:hypothetical protein
VLRALAVAVLLCMPGAMRLAGQDTPATEDAPVTRDSLVTQDTPADDTLSFDSLDVPDVVAKHDSGAAARIVFDSSVVAVRMPDDSAMKSYRSDGDFVYDREQREPESLWDRFVRWLQRLIGRVGGGDAESTIFEWVCYGLAAAVIVFVILKLIGSDIRGLFMHGRRSRVSDFIEVDENIHEMNFDALIAEAVAAGQYRRAVRLLYLKGLKALTDGGAIDWRKGKTNRDYLHELRESPLRAPFADATLLFEYVWYGDMPIDESVFRSVRENLEGFITTIGRRP